MNVEPRFLVLIMILFLTACSSLPNATRTGTVKEILIAEDLSPLQATVRTGDEIRWINQREGHVQIVFLDPIEDRIACYRGFGFGGVANATRLAPNNSISLCFSMPGPVQYIIRMDTMLPTGELNVRGVIQVEKNGKAS